MVPLESLFDYQRVSSPLIVSFLILYSPFGLILLVIRFFIGFHAYLLSCIIPKQFPFRNFVLRPMSCLLGIIVRQKGCHDKKAKVVVSNYRTSLDHLVFQLIMPHYVVSTWQMTRFSHWLLGYLDLDAQNSKDVLLKNAQNFIKTSDLPLLIFPEGETTNGRRGLLKFSSWPFSLGVPVEPASIKIWRPFFHLPPSLINSSLLIDLFWVFFLPITYFEISFLPLKKKKDETNEEELGKRAALEIASDLSLQLTNHRNSDKIQLIKDIKSFNSKDFNYQREEKSLHQMLKRVKQVLPHVQEQTIKKFLDKTKDVDLTIMSLLENKEITEESKIIKSTCKINNIFSTSAKERHLSFQERKELMVNRAKQNYLDKNAF